MMTACSHNLCAVIVSHNKIPEDPECVDNINLILLVTAESDARVGEAADMFVGEAPQDIYWCTTLLTPRSYLLQ